MPQTKKSEASAQAAHLEPLSRLKKDLKDAVTTLSAGEARFLVDAYYTVQENRKRSAEQVRSLATAKEPHLVLQWLFDQDETLENQIKIALDRWTVDKPLGQWARSIVGIGPVIAAGLLAHIDINKATTAGKIWRFAGLDPTSVWKKGEKRPWNASLKTLAWKCGESFVKVQNLGGDFYGKVYAQRKEFEKAMNLEGKYSDQAKLKLEKFNIGKDTDAYGWYAGCYTAEVAKLALDSEAPNDILKGRKLKPGEGLNMLPPAHIHSRAKRYAVKLFLAHYHHVAYVLVLKQEPPRPYIIEHGGHIDFIAPPNFPLNRRLDSAPPEV